MNAKLFVKSKLILPEIPQKMLLTERLKNLSIETKRVTVITAPAGFGKTTAVLLSLKKQRNHVKWYRLEAEDARLHVFYAHLIETIFGNAALNLDCKKMLSGISDIAEEYPLINAQLCQDISILKNTGRVFLVFDDFHYAVENRPIVETIRYFAANMPEFVSIVVTSRIETGILTGRLTLDPASLSITDDDLRLTKEESEKLVRSVYKLNYSESELLDVLESSEGWIAGLYMICHNGIKPTNKINLRDGSLFERYFREFYSDLPDQKRNVLAKLSIVPDFSEDEVALFGYDDGKELLEWLEKSNLYIQKTAARTVRFRFHSLFRRELNNMLNQVLNLAELQSLFGMTATYYEKNGDIPLAVKLYLHTGNTEKAADIARNYCIKEMDSGHLENLGRIIGELPDAIIAGCPYLLFFKAVTYQNISHEMCLNYALAALKTFRSKKDVSYLMNAFGMILVITFQTNHFEKLKEASKYLPLGRIALKGGIPLQKLLIGWASGAVANENFKRATALFKLIDRMGVVDPVWNYCRLMVKSILLYRTGRLAGSMDNFNELLNNPVGYYSDQWKITALVSGHLAVSLAADIDKARATMDEFAVLGKKYGSYFAQGFTYRMAAFIAYQTNNHTSALEYIQKSAEAFECSKSPVLAYTSLVTCYFWKSETEDVSEQAKHCLVMLRSLTDYDVGHGFTELCKAMTAGVLIKDGQYDEAEKMLLDALKASKDKGAIQSVCGTLMQLIELNFLKGTQEKTVQYLEAWHAHASEHGYLFFWESDRLLLIRVCALSVCAGFKEYPAKIIGRQFSEKAVEMLLAKPEWITHDPAVLLPCKNEATAISSVVTVNLLGKFKLTAFGTVVTDDSFKTKKIGGILKYILMNREKSVSREVLADMFWPDSDPKSAFMSLRVALSELRKVLASCGLSFDSETALICEGKNGFYVGKGNTICFDTDSILSLYKKYKTERHSGDEAAAAMQSILAMYDGDLLGDSPYDDWIMVSRERYRSIFVEVSHAAANYYFDEKDFEKAESTVNKHLFLEPLDEIAFSMLLKIYQKTGRESSIGGMRRQFEKRYFEKMGEKPSLLELTYKR